MKTLSLTGLLPEEISSLLPGKKETYRGDQIFRWIHQHNVDSFDDMTNLSKEFRKEIPEYFSIGSMIKSVVITSQDGTTEKYVWELDDGNNIESVIIRDDNRITACISSQVGCKMRCSFCRTGLMGFRRNLTCGEILEQLLTMRRALKATGEDITNIVFMGMGEPLDNLDTVLKAIRIINMETALSIAQRKITVSTCGLVPGMDRVAREFKNIGMALSLNAPDDALRSQLMPVNRRYPMHDLLEAARNYTQLTKRRVTFEYILIDGINDSPEHARKLLRIARSMPSKINLLGFNEFDESPYKRSSSNNIELFQQVLFDGHVTALLRKSRGDDILAACGQLAVLL